MLGFDLLQALNHYPGMGWLKYAPGDFGTQSSFVSFQWLMQYNFEGLSNNMCNWNFAMGIGATRPGDPGPQRKAIRGCNTKHWNDFFTLGLGGNGYFKGKLEQRLAAAYEPNGKQWLLYGQWWWRSFYDLPVDLSMGTSWFPVVAWTTAGRCSTTLWVGISCGLRRRIIFCNPH